MKPKWFERWLQRREEHVDAMASGQEAFVADTESTTHWATKALWIGGVLFVLWGAFAPLGRGVPVQGFVVVDGSRKTIQHPKGGVVEAILVREGDAVKAGQPLIRLSPTLAQAQQGTVEAQLASMLALQSRLLAEREGRSKLVFPAFLREREKSAPPVAELMRAQEILFTTRLSAMQGELSILAENANALEKQMEGLRAREKSNDVQYKLYVEELAAIKPLFEQGFVPRQRVFELERTMVQLDGMRNENRADLLRLSAQLSEVRLKMAMVRQARQKEVDSQLTEVQREVATLKERFVASSDELERVVLKAPEAGSVVEMSVHTLGGVVAPGQKLMDIVPQGTRLIVEVDIPVHLIDTVAVGQQVDLHFTALDQTLVPVADGKLIYVAADRKTDERMGVSTFTGRVEITAQGVQDLKGQALRPGMPADAVIKTGERTFFAYMLKPLLTRMQFAMTER